MFDCIFLLPLSENLASGASSAELRPTDDPSAEKTAELTQRVCPVKVCLQPLLQCHWYPVLRCWVPMA